MALKPGTLLGPYEIVSAIGAGGMGEVYRARDTRLHRSVAIKVLPPHLSAEPELRERFEREARAISSLNHPNICVLHDIGRQDGFDYLVMEYLEGETLAERLATGELTVEQSLRYAVEIGDALHRAHRQGVTHRDLKPGNIMITASGAKLLDFGLAKRRQTADWVVPSSSMLATEAGQLTMQGTILGTLQYMSPEQLEGRDADPRTDLFALGAVMYEMLTGRKAFEGKSQASLIAAIVHVDPPPVSTLKPLTSAALDRVVKKCLAKDPEERWQSAKDLVDELRWIADGGHSSSFPAQTVAATPVRHARWSSIAAAVFFVSTAVLAAFILLHREPAAPGVIRVEITPPEDADFGNPSFPNFAMSPDGRLLTFAVEEKGPDRLWVRALDAPVSRVLNETGDGQRPFWSPDGRYIGFFADGKLKKVEVSGGAPLTLSEVKTGVGSGGTWSRDGTILFSAGFGSGLLRISENGGEAKAVTTLGDKEAGHFWPQFLPDGRHFIYLSLGQALEDSAIVAASLDGGAPKSIVRSASRAAHAGGYLFFLRDAVLLAQALDPRSLELRGEPVRVAEQIAANNNGGAGFAVSESGTILYRTGGAGDQRQRFVWVDRAGKPTDIVADTAQHRTYELSPDGRRLAAHRHDDTSARGDLWIVELERRLTTRFTFDNAHNFAPVWSPDGSRIAYASRKQGVVADIYQRLTTGAANEELLLKTSDQKQTLDWSRDDRFILYQTRGPKTQLDLWVLPLSGERKPVPVLETTFNEYKGRFSPDGKWIAYTSDESGSPQVYIQSFPPSGGKWQVSTTGGLEPQWRGDGRELFYLSSQTRDARLMAVPLKWTSVPEAGAPAELFAVPTGNMGVDDTNHYAVAANGQRFVIQVNTTDATPAPDSIVVLANWLVSVSRP